MKSKVELEEVDTKTKEGQGAVLPFRVYPVLCDGKKKTNQWPKKKGRQTRQVISELPSPQRECVRQAPGVSRRTST